MPNIGTASLEELREYSRKRKEVGLGNQKEKVDTTVSKTPKVEIDTSGIKDVGLRADLAGAENDKEYELRLNRAGFKEDQYFKDPEKG